MKHRHIRQRVFFIISKAEEGDRASRAFDLTIMALIVLSVTAIVLQSFENLALRFANWFTAFECVTVAVFTLEYAARIWTADLLYPNAEHPRLKYILSPMALVDLCAILPFYLPFLGFDMRFLRLVRLFRLLRMFKLGRYSEALQTVVAVMKESASQLIISILMCLFIMLSSAIIMYTVENPVQPEQFPNVIASLWWAICTLTTVGYGDVYPVTAIGRLFASIISLVGIGIIAIPTGIIAAGFSKAIGQTTQTKQEPKSYCPYCGKKLE
ncbi:MAG: ion transporter [Clostridia bacterium]|nr:ion transporter [Clostridia bacterium]